MALRKGCYTALITPFTNVGKEIDYDGLGQLIEFQVQNEVDGILTTGTTGESPTLIENEDEHADVIIETAEYLRGRTSLIAGTGSNSTKESLHLTKRISHVPGLDGILLVDPYYNGPSSLEIFKEYIEPVAIEFPKLEVIPYVIPGRTGTQLFPEDLAAAAKLNNVNAVKEATGSTENMKKTRKKCGKDFLIFSGDDGMTLEMMSDPDIAAGGLISVMSNIFPGPMTQMVKLLNQGNVSEAEKIHRIFGPLFDAVTVTTSEDGGYGTRAIRARNPLAVKTLMNILGMPAGPCRRPLGKMTKTGLGIMIVKAREVQKTNPEFFAPIAEFFGVNIDDRLYLDESWMGLSY